MRFILAFFLCFNLQAEEVKRRVLVFGLDGTRGDIVGDLIKEDKLVGLSKFRDNGILVDCAHKNLSGCARAHSTPGKDKKFEWKTGPGWASVITGQDSSKHKVRNNGHEKFKVFHKTTYYYPTIFKVLKSYGLKTAAAGVGAFLSSYNDEKLYPGVTDYECGANEDSPKVSPESTSSCNLTYRHAFNNDDDGRDDKLTSWYTKMIDSDADLIFGVYDTIDETGHKKGFSHNKKYLKSIVKIDKKIKSILDHLEQRIKQHNEEWLVLTTSDHGGHKIFVFGTHTNKVGKDDIIPFGMMTYPRTNLKLRQPVTHMDLFPTIIEWYSIPHFRNDGKVQGI